MSIRLVLAALFAFVVSDAAMAVQVTIMRDDWGIAHVMD
jgi:hypothetical protein